MTLAVYPLVYLPVAASLRAADPGQEEVARSLGVGPAAHLRPDHPGPGPRRHPGRLPAGRAGAAGRVRRVRDARLPDLHHRDLHRVQPVVQRARRLRAVPGPGRAQPAGAGRRGPGPRPRPDGPVGRRGTAGQPAAAAGPGDLARRWPRSPRWSCWRSACRSAPSIYWIFAGGVPSVTGGSVSMLNAAWHTAAYGVSAGGHRHRWPRCRWRCWPSGTPAGVRHFLERSTYLVLAMPGVVIGFALTYFTEQLRGQAPATRPRRCWSSATRSCSSRSRWSG